MIAQKEKKRYARRAHRKKTSWVWGETARAPGCPAEPSVELKTAAGRWAFCRPRCGVPPGPAPRGKQKVEYARRARKTTGPAAATAGMLLYRGGASLYRAAVSPGRSTVLPGARKRAAIASSNRAPGFICTGTGFFSSICSSKSSAPLIPLVLYPK